MNLNEAISEYLIAKRADGVTRASYKWYQSIINSFGGWVGDKPLSDITAKDIRGYIIMLQDDREYSDDTIHAHRRVLHNFWSWCKAEWDINNPMGNIAYPSPPKKKIPKTIHPDVMVAFFESLPHNHEGIRDKAITALLCDSAPRSGELCAIRLEDVDLFKRSFIASDGKTGSKTYFFSRFSAVLLADWIRVRSDSEWLFYNMNTLNALTTSGIYQMFLRRAKQAGITGRVNPQSWRHAFAREYLKDGGDLVTLSRLMGHSSVEVTAESYAVFFQNEYMDKHDRHSPIKHLTNRTGKE